MHTTSNKRAAIAALASCYRQAGFSEDQCQRFAAEWLAALTREPVGTIWQLGPNAAGVSVSVRRD